MQILWILVAIGLMILGVTLAWVAIKNFKQSDRWLELFKALIIALVAIVIFGVGLGVAQEQLHLFYIY